MSASGAVPSRPGILLLHLTSGKDLLILQQDCAKVVLSFSVFPDPGEDVINRIDEVVVAIIADTAMGTLGGVARNGQLGVNKQVQPISGLCNIICLPVSEKVGDY